MPNPTEEMIEAGCQALHEMREAMYGREQSERPEDLPDYDEGDLCRAIYLAMSRLDPERERLRSALETIRAEPPVNYDSALNAERIIRLVEIANAALNSEVSHDRE